MSIWQFYLTNKLIGHCLKSNRSISSIPSLLNISSTKHAIPIGGYYISIIRSLPLTTKSTSDIVSSEINTNDSTPEVRPPTKDSVNTNIIPHTPPVSSNLPNSELSAKYKTAPEISSKPIEPDNCCMSGCVNCVWEIYSEELGARAGLLSNVEDKTKEHSSSILAKDAQIRKASDYNLNKGCKLSRSRDPRNEMEECQFTTKDGMYNPLPRNISGNVHGTPIIQDKYSDLPVGIREFLRQEELLKKKRST